MIGGGRSHARAGVVPGLAALVGVCGLGVVAGAQESGAVARGTPAGPPVLRADAGDDQLAILGRQVTLAGNRSRPREQVGFRWIQVGGPPARLRLEEGMFLSFVPEEPGRYRFALVIAVGSRISEPATVEVVAQAASKAARPPGPGPSLEDQIRAGLLALPEGPALAGPLSDVFDRIAQRMDLYSSYGEAFQEMSRQLDVLVPAEPARRRAWIDGLFRPLTGNVIDVLRADGLDLRLPGAQDAALTPAQKQRLATVFRALAEGARGAGQLSSR
jgi:hypothetical protein